MGWVEDQIQERRAQDQQLFEDSFFHAAGVVLGKADVHRIIDGRIVTKQAIDEILKYYHYKPVQIPDDLQEHDQQVDYCLRMVGMMRREITLEEGWFRDAFGPILAYRRETGEPVALLPGRLGGYYYKDNRSARVVRLSDKTAEQFQRDAVCFYRPLPQRSLKITDLLLYLKNCIAMRDLIYICAATLAAVSVGRLLPRITKALTGPVRLSGDARMLVGIAICLFCTAISAQLISSVQNMVQTRVQTKAELGVQSSMMMRILSLPVSFFRQYSPGEMMSRSSSVNELCSLLLGMVLSTGLTSLFSLLYVADIFHFAPALVIPALIIITVTAVTSVISSLIQSRIIKQRMDVGARENGLSYSIITGIQKIRLAGAEKRFFARWLDMYAEEAAFTYNPPMFIRINGVIQTAISLASNIVLYFLAVRSGVSQSDYFAFTAAYSSLMGAFTALAGITLSVARIRPILEIAEPFLQAKPETADNKAIVHDLMGSIELNNVCFRYDERSPYIVENLSLKIAPGEYVAIVGRTGCGKSTLMRLLLGFEKPERGAVYYDGKDINSLCLSSLRGSIGTVMQNAGLFQGSIYENIVISAPQLTLKDAWEAAEMAGIADDIRDMPMGMQTMISEGQGGISGGQKQRIIIARAVAPKPSILMFDEATSALDNRTQRQVSEALDGMGCTRIVIAHRLSTIRHCDRILVLDKGQIIEDGTYEELIARKGFFADLVERQQVEAAGG
ncbi:MAG: ATP-binding cassette domain-containing protein [Butyrivibrio sp.]|nr:ATP-binding cassette domain-containing protein [Butyrivibrio sp.]